MKITPEWLRAIKLLSHLSVRRRIQFIGLVFLSIASSCSEMVSIGLIFPLLGILANPIKISLLPSFLSNIDFVKFSTPQELLLLITILFVFAVLISAFVRFLLQYAQTKFSFMVGADISSQIYKNVLYQPYLVHVSRNSSEVISSVLSRSSVISGSIILPGLTMVSSFFIMVGILLTIILIKPFIAISIFFAFSLMYILVSIVTKSMLYKNSKTINSEMTNVLRSIQEGLGGIRDILIDGTQKIYFDNYRLADIRLRRSQATIAMLGTSPRYVIEALGIAMIAIFAFLLASDGAGFEQAIPTLGLLALGAQRMLPVLQQAYAAFSQIQGSQATLDEVLTSLDQGAPLCQEHAFDQAIDFRESIVARNICFQYDKDLPIVINDLNIKITRGDRIGLIGKTGSGKSTLIDIIMGLINPTSGDLIVDGTIIDEMKVKTWQRNIAHVSQVIFLADASVSENIAFGIPAEKIDHIKVKEAAKKAQLDKVIDGWVNGYSTIVGERGIRLSGGQRQRIGIARALYKNAKLIVMDEATSALDEETERLIIEDLNKLDENLTLITIAHRMSTLKYCSVIYELQNGKIERQLTYEELI